MPKKSKTESKILGIVLVTVGAGLAFWGHQKSGGVQSQLSNVLTGSHSDNVMLLYIGGAVGIALGLFFFVKR